MRSLAPLGVLGLFALTSSFADAATIAGTVKGPDGAAFRGAFVQARNAKTKITVSVLSDNEGRYHVDNLAAGDYRVQIRAPGYRADTKNGLALAADQNATQDFALQKSFVRWGDISYFQGQKLLPDIRGKDTFFQHCIACHGFQSRIANVKRDEDGIRSRVAYMREAMGVLHRRGAARLHRR